MKRFRTIGTSMHEVHCYKNPSPATLTKIDKTIDKAVLCIERIDTARGFSNCRTQHELVMLVQFVCKFIVKHRCTLTTAVKQASRIFCWSHGDIFRIMKDYFANVLCENTPALPKMKIYNVRGRGSELFKQRWGDRFYVLKQVHLVEMLKYVRRSNAMGT